MGGPHTDDELDTLLAGGRLGAAAKDRVEEQLLAGAARPTRRRRRQALAITVVVVLVVIAGVLLLWRVAAAADATTAAGGRPDGFVDLAEVAPSIDVDMRYATARNFVGRPIRGYRAGRCLLARPAAQALAEVARDLTPSGLGLRVYDCYRPRRAVADFVAWARDVTDTATRAVHYPDVPKAELFKRGYIAHRSGHSRGATVDLTLIPLPAPPRGDGGAAAAPTTAAGDCRVLAGPRAPDGSLDMGTAFDCFDERSNTDDPRVTPAARRNRDLLRSAMQKRGFANYAREWWHFTLADEPFPDTAFDFEVR